MNVNENVNPESFQKVWDNLDLIEASMGDYEDPDDGDTAPSQEVFAAVREFLVLLRGACARANDTKLETPSLFVSSGDIVLTLVNRSNRNMNVRFTPEVRFDFFDSEAGPIAGQSMQHAVELAAKYFRR